MLKFVWNFTAMFVFVFVGLAAIMGVIFCLLWAAVHFGGDYAIPILLLAVISGTWATAFAISEQSK